MNTTTFHILVSLWRDAHPARAIRERVAEMEGGALPPITSFYRALATAEEDGWLEIVAQSTGTGGRPAQVYRITDTGRTAVREHARHLRDLTDLVLAQERAGPRSGE